MITGLRHDTLGKLGDGSAATLIDNAIAKVVDDIEDRGHDGKPRKVTIELSLVADGSSIKADVAVKATVPATRSMLTVGKVRKVGDQLLLAFQDDNADNPDQERGIYRDTETDDAAE